MAYGKNASDNTSLGVKVRMREAVLEELANSIQDPPIIFDGYAGGGAIWRRCYLDSPVGVCVDKKDGAIEQAALDRPEWICAVGDTAKLLGAGFCSHLQFDLFDLDAYGSVLPPVKALLGGRQTLKNSFWIVATDGMGLAVHRNGKIPSLQKYFVRFGEDYVRRNYGEIAFAWVQEMAAEAGFLIEFWKLVKGGKSGMMCYWAAKLQRALSTTQVEELERVLESFRSR